MQVLSARIFPFRLMYIPDSVIIAETIQEDTKKKIRIKQQDWWTGLNDSFYTANFRVGKMQELQLGAPRIRSTNQKINCPHGLPYFLVLNSTIVRIMIWSQNRLLRLRRLSHHSGR